MLGFLYFRWGMRAWHFIALRHALSRRQHPVESVSAIGVRHSEGQGINAGNLHRPHEIEKYCRTDTGLACAAQGHGSRTDA